MTQAEIAPTAGDVKRLKKFHKGRKPIKVRWIQEYVRRGWITHTPPVRAVGFFQSGRPVLSEVGLKIAYQHGDAPC